MANQTPSKRRKLGREAFDPDSCIQTKWYLNPWRNNDGTLAHKFDAACKAQDFDDGWAEAELAYEPPQTLLETPVVLTSNDILELQTIGYIEVEQGDRLFCITIGKGDTDAD